MPETCNGFWNWAKTHRICNIDSVVEIENESALIELLSTHRHTRFRVLGSRYSHTDLLRENKQHLPDSTLDRDRDGDRDGGSTVVPLDGSDSSIPVPIDAVTTSDVDDHKVIILSKMTGMIDIEDDGVWFWAGTQLKNVFKQLQDLGRMMTCAPGVISEQTIAGAISTGTHGQGLSQCSLSDAVLALRLITVDGYVYDLDETHPWFNAAILSLGCLGIITRVKVATRTFTQFVCHKVTVDVETFQANFAQWNSKFEMAKAWWFPDENRVHIWLSNQKKKEKNNNCDDNCDDKCDKNVVSHRSDIDEKLSDTLNLTEMSIDEAVDNSIEAMQRDTHHDNVDEAKVFQTVTRFRNDATVTDNVYTIWCKGIPVPQINVEIAVPLHSFKQVISELREMIRTTAERTHYPIIFRCTGSSRAWLAPSGSDGTEVCHIGFVVYFADDGYVSAEGISFVYKAEVLLAQFGGRPHWGKYYSPQLFDWPKLYPKMDEFKKLQTLLDPNHRLNEDCESLLLAKRAPYASK